MTMYNLILGIYTLGVFPLILTCATALPSFPRILEPDQLTQPPQM